MRIKGRPEFDKENLTDDKVYDCLLHIKTSIEMLIEKRERLKDKQVQEEIFSIFDDVEYETTRLAIYFNPKRKGWWFV